MGIDTWIETFGWDNEQVQNVIEEVAKEFIDERDKLFDYWETIRNDPSVSSEEKARVMAEMASYSSFADTDVSSFVLGAYGQRIIERLKAKYPTSDIIFKDSEGNTLEIHKEFENGVLKSETITDRSANGDYTSETYDKDGNLLSSHEHTTDADGNTTDTYKQYNEDGTIKREFITKKAPDGSFISMELKDGNGNILDHFEASPNGEDSTSPDHPAPPPPPEPPPPPRGGDPLVLDLGGNGIITTGLDAGIHFDHDGDGFRELSGFVNSEDGLVVLDRNGDGKINGGGELFGDSTRLLNGEIAVHGFAALSEFDDDKNGVVDKDDAIFDKLRIFQDFNQNGKADAGELFSLEEKKIAGLNMTYQNSPFVDKFGNAHRQLGTYVTESDETRTMTDVVFAMNRTLTETEMLPVPTDIAVLPDAVGYGTTYSLHQAMVRDESGRLKELVRSFVACSDRAERHALTEKIVYAWTGQDQILATETVKKIYVLDSFFGTALGNNWLRALNRFDQVLDTVHYQLMRDSHLQPLFNNVTYSLNSRANTYVGRFDNVVPVLATMLERTPEASHELVEDFVRAVRAGYRGQTTISFPRFPHSPQIFSRNLVPGGPGKPQKHPVSDKM